MQNVHCVIQRKNSDSFDVIYYKDAKHLLVIEWLHICSKMTFREGIYDEFDSLLEESGVFNRLSMISREFLVNNFMIYASSTDDFDVLCAALYILKNINNMGFVRICNEINRICLNRLGAQAESFPDLQDIPECGVKILFAPGDNTKDELTYEYDSSLKYLIIPRVSMQISVGSAIQCFDWAYLQGIFKTGDLYEMIRMFALKYSFPIEELQSAVCALIIQRAMYIKVNPNVSFRDFLKSIKEVSIDEV